MKKITTCILLLILTFSCSNQEENKIVKKEKVIVKEIIKYKKEFTNPLGMKFVYIKPGTFDMGSIDEPDGGRLRTSTHKVTLTKGFYMQTTETTVGSFKQFVKETNHKTQAEKNKYQKIFYFSKTRVDKAHITGKKGHSWKKPGYEITDIHPVTLVSWKDAQAFIKWLNKKYGNYYRLPTEAEWEYSCRAGTKTHFYNGNLKETVKIYDYLPDQNLNKIAWYDWNSDGKAHPVGLKEPNKWGLYDMLGNISEYCEDDYVYLFRVRHATDPLFKNKDNNADITVRGGSWWFPPYLTTNSTRSFINKKSCTNLRGFRVVKNVTLKDLKDEYKSKEKVSTKSK